MRREIPDGRPSWGHLRLVARNLLPDHAEKMFEGRYSQLDGLSLASAKREGPSESPC